MAALLAVLVAAVVTMAVLGLHSSSRWIDVLLLLAVAGCLALMALIMLG